MQNIIILFFIVAFISSCKTSRFESFKDNCISFQYPNYLVKPESYLSDENNVIVDFDSDRDIGVSVYYMKDYSMQETEANMVSVFQQMPADMDRVQKVAIDTNTNLLYSLLPPNAKEIKFTVYDIDYIYFRYFGFWQKDLDVYAIFITLKDDKVSPETLNDLKHTVGSIANRCR